MAESFLLCCQYKSTRSNFEHEGIANLYCYYDFYASFKLRGCDFIFMKWLPASKKVGEPTMLSLLGILSLD